MELEVEKTSPYAQGTIIDYGDGTYTLERPDEPFWNLQGSRHYTVVEGDELDALAERFYGSFRNWHIIATANPHVEDFINLTPGIDLIIPSPNQFEV